MRTLWDRIQSDDVKKAHPQIDWSFIPPRASHVNGAVERLVQSAKRAMLCTMSERTLTDEQLETAIVVAESILNNRPLCYVTNEAEDLTPLTPNHFLAGTALIDVAPIGNEKLKLAERWKHVQMVMDRFWNQFKAEIIPNMQQINKWTQEKPDLGVGDVVIMIEKNPKMKESALSVARGAWPLGLVTKIHRSRDGKVRFV